jgi:hypothetical protein
MHVLAALPNTRCRCGGLLVNAELAADVSTPEYTTLRDAWVSMHRTAGLGMTPDYLGRDVAVSSAVDIEAMLGRAGFSESTVFFQALLIGAWCSRVWRGEQGDYQRAHRRELETRPSAQERGSCATRVTPREAHVTA